MLREHRYVCPVEARLPGSGLAGCPVLGRLGHCGQLLSGPGAPETPGWPSSQELTQSDGHFLFCLRGLMAKLWENDTRSPGISAPHQPVYDSQAPPV